VAIAPLIAIEPVGDAPVALDGYDWLVLTSAAGARELKQRMSGRAARVAAIGQATADAIPGANLLVVPGMGHALPISKWPLIVDAIAAHAV